MENPHRGNNYGILPTASLHPGWDAPNCELRITVGNPTTNHQGFACDWTGGHCLPNKETCPSRRAEKAAFDIEQAKWQVPTITNFTGMDK